MEVLRGKKENLTALIFNSDSFILKEISLLDLAGGVLFQQEVSAFQSKKIFFVKFPKFENKNELLLFISTSNGDYSNLIKLPAKSVTL